MTTGAEQTRWENALAALDRGAPKSASESDSRHSLVRLLALLGSAATLNELLEGLAIHIEAGSEGLHCTVLIVDPTRRVLTVAASPSLPSSYIDAIGEVAIVAGQGSCGTAAARGEMVIVDDIERSDLWATSAPIALSHGLRACWSTSMFDDAGMLLGTLALYYRQRRTPTATEIDFIQGAAALASFAIQRHRDSGRLRASEARLAAAVWGTDIGLWESGADGDYVWFDDWNERFDIEPCLGHDQERRWRERIHPEDRERYDKLADAVENGGIDHYVAEYRILTRSGVWRWLHDRGQVIARDAKGKAQRYIGLCLCVDEQKKLETALRAAENHYEFAVKAARLPVWEYDVRSDTVTGNSYWHHTVGHEITDAEAAKRVETWLSDVHPDDVDRNSKLFTPEATDETGFIKPSFGSDYRAASISGCSIAVAWSSGTPTRRPSRSSVSRSTSMLRSDWKWIYERASSDFEVLSNTPPSAWLW